MRMPTKAGAGPAAAARRSTELGLVTLAVILAAGGYVLTALAKGATLPADLAPFAAGAAGLALAGTTTTTTVPAPESSSPTETTR